MGSGEVPALIQYTNVPSQRWKHTAFSRKVSHNDVICFNEIKQRRGGRGRRRTCSVVKCNVFIGVFLEDGDPLDELRRGRKGIRFGGLVTPSSIQPNSFYSREVWGAGRGVQRRLTVHPISLRSG